MDCTNCGAPLPATSHICPYCKTLNDVDLRAIHADAKKGPVSDRICPRCQLAMTSIDLQLDGPFYVERCSKCLGIFFDPNELETIVESTASNAQDTDYRRLTQIARDEAPDVERAAPYIKCPDCQALMNRKKFGSRTNVVTHQCRDHGVWLDGGDLAALIKWAKAGGLAYSEKRRKEENRLDKSRKDMNRSTPTGVCSYGADYDNDHTRWGRSESCLVSLALGALSCWLRR